MLLHPVLFLASISHVLATPLNHARDDASSSSSSSYQNPPNTDTMTGSSAPSTSTSISTTITASVDSADGGAFTTTSIPSSQSTSTYTDTNTQTPTTSSSSWSSSPSTSSSASQSASPTNLPLASTQSVSTMHTKHHPSQTDSSEKTKTLTLKPGYTELFVFENHSHDVEYIEVIFSTSTAGGNSAATTIYSCVSSQGMKSTSTSASTSAATTSSVAGPTHF